MDTYTVGGLVVYRFVYEYIDANMYVILNGEDALIVDPHQSDALLPFLEKNTVKTVTVLLTHEHYDHICGISQLKEKYDINIICSRLCAEHMKVTQNNRPLLIHYILAEEDRISGTQTNEIFKTTYTPFSHKADTTFDDTHTQTWSGRTLQFQRTPGHSPGSSCILIDDTILFTGDTLQKNLPTITRFPGGNRKDFQNISLPYLRSLAKDVFALPGHGEGFTLEEKNVDTTKHIMELR